MPRLSIVIPTYNRGHYIFECLQSIWDQGYQDYEILVVDDGSTDNTLEILQPLIENKKVKLLHQTKSGAAAARNKGVINATGELIAFLDSDDIFYPSKLKKQAEYMDQHPSVMILHSNFNKFDDFGNDLGTKYTSFFSGHIYPEILLYWEMLMATSCVIVRADLFNEIGLFDEDLTSAEDLDLWARIARKYPIHHMPEILAGIRVHPQNISVDKSKMAERHLKYLHKAAKEDPNLGEAFEKKMYSRLFMYSGFNMLGEGTQKEMQIVRKFMVTSLKYWPRQLKSLLGYLASLLDQKSRYRLTLIWRPIRDQRLAIKKIFP
ncbi:MAG: glycosyltransferase [Chloroflexi bacterium]|nr:glycosyltransferase [Chloroflexota bacterium]